ARRPAAPHRLRPRRRLARPLREGQDPRPGRDPFGVFCEGV
ncbi:MAG: hypothetical protein AVDCRST_MAG25-2844, partial [uncultured Rubrobacteraceae bacterium]